MPRFSIEESPPLSLDYISTLIAQRKPYQSILKEIKSFPYRKDDDIIEDKDITNSFPSHL